MNDALYTFGYSIELKIKIISTLLCYAGFGSSAETIFWQA
jgi:hypothetical protein